MIRQDLLDSLQETVEFYKDAFHTYPSERDDVAHQITRYVLPREMKGKFLQMIDRLDSSKKPIRILERAE